VPSAPTFHVVSGSVVRRIIDVHRSSIFEAVETAYRLHASGNTLNPDSYFLRYPDKPSGACVS
jgi:ornithine cyclodeaminase